MEEPTQPLPRKLRFRRPLVVPPSPPLCVCGHPDVLHLGLTGRCLAPSFDVQVLWADSCSMFRETKKPGEPME